MTAQKPLNQTAAAKRAITEAEQRRKLRENETKLAKKEIGGRKGPDPTRFGDWEKNGITSDF